MDSCTLSISFMSRISVTLAPDLLWSKLWDLLSIKFNERIIKSIKDDVKNTMI